MASAFFLLLLAFGVGLGFLLRPVSLPSEGVALYVPPEVSAHWIADRLQRQGVIRSSLCFRIYIHWQGIDQRISPGEYLFRGRLSLAQVAEQLARGPVRWRITVPEGYTLEQLAELLQAKGIADSQEFWQVAEHYPFSYSFLHEAPAGRRRLEGYLFPDTYVVPAGTPLPEILNLMLERFAQVSREMDLEAGAREQGLTLNQLVTMASLVEREAKYDDERPLIAGVLYHRLHIGMPLQVDATVAYALNQWDRPLTHSDLQVDSPYNTYRIQGLPPGPIAFPGKASLEAVLYPQATDYLYYVAKPDGHHAFARTLIEHEENIRRYQG
ncbi:endolytic transglycosylase MltG [Desulfothermobacter acidiphilus]|uniref:endolytic transglycosylase MltG n=1 Tax=Desulfothermobacter acidiphilus TaxID=1938353 RepID=UPI003F88DE7C